MVLEVMDNEKVVKEQIIGNEELLKEMGYQEQIKRTSDVVGEKMERNESLSQPEWEAMLFV